jgi:hypothetical protein
MVRIRLPKSAYWIRQGIFDQLKSFEAFEARVKTLARKKRTHAGKIAKELKRTEGATRQKAFSIGLSLDARV